MIRRTLAIFAALGSLAFGTGIDLANGPNGPTYTVAKHCYRSGTTYACPSATVAFSGWGDGDHGVTVWTQAGAFCNGGVAHAYSWTGDAASVTYWASGRGSIGGVCVSL